MKLLHLLLLLFFTSTFPAVAQHDEDRSNMVGFGCYESGESSASVLKVTKLLQEAKYYKIRTLLTSKNNAEKVLAVAACEKLAADGKLVLTDEDLAAIQEARTSEDLLWVCSGCIYFETITVKDFLNAKSNPLQIPLQHWLQEK